LTDDQGRTTLDDWRPVFSLVSGALPADLITAIYPSFSNSCGLFAATLFESAKGGPAAFALAGTVKDAWLNAELFKTDATFTVTARPGANVIVFQLAEKNLPAVLKLGSPDVTFLSN